MNQTYENIEIIVMIDGSKDNSEKIAREFAQKDKRIQIIVKENEGALKARVDAIEEARGEYIFSVDPDDWIETNAVERLLIFAKKYNADIVRARGIREIVEINKRKLLPAAYEKEYYIEQKDFKEKFYPKVLRTFSCNSIWGQLIKKDIIDTTNLDTSIHMGDDLNLNLEIYKKMKNIVFIPDVVYHYRYNNTSITKRTELDYVYKKASDIGKVYYKLLECLKEWDMNTKENQKIVAIKLLRQVNVRNIDIFENKNKEENIEYIKKIMQLPEVEKCRKIVDISDLKKNKNKSLKYLYLKDINKYYKVMKNKIYLKIKVRNKLYLIYKQIVNIGKNI